MAGLTALSLLGYSPNACKALNPGPGLGRRGEHEGKSWRIDETS